MACRGNAAATDKYAQAFYEEIRDSTLNQKYKLPEFNGIHNIVDVISQFIFRVTYYHEVVGVVVQYMSDPFAYALRLRESQDGELMTEADVQSFFAQYGYCCNHRPQDSQTHEPIQGLHGKRWGSIVGNDCVESLPS